MSERVPSERGAMIESRSAASSAKSLFVEVTLHLPEREIFIDNLLVRIQIIIEMISVDRSRAMGVSIPFSR